ncbi:MAG: nuclear transport factor 2 family protein, partial [Waterburya sp.]
ITIILLFNKVILESLPTNFLITSSTMNQQEIKTIVDRQARAWETEDVETIIADFAENGLFIAAKKQFKGKQAIKTAAENYFSQYTAIKINIKRLIVQGNSGAIEWDWSDRDRQTGVIGNAEDAIIFELENNKIIYWREYIDKVN